MFDSDIRHYAPVPRTLSGSKFGAYAQLTVPARRSRASALIYALIGIGIACAAVVAWLGVI